MSMLHDHVCPVDGCETMVANAKLMCWTHWREVPARLQGDVYAAWRRRLSGEPGGLQEHAQACENAVAAVERRAPKELVG